MNKLMPAFNIEVLLELRKFQVLNGNQEGITFHLLSLDFSHTLKCYAATSLFLQACCRSWYLHNFGSMAHNPNSNDFTRLTGPPRFNGRALQPIIWKVMGSIPFGKTVCLNYLIT